MVLLFVLISLASFLSAPTGYSYTFCLINVALFGCLFIMLIKSRRARFSLLSFNVLFSLSWFLVTYLVPLFVLQLDVNINFIIGEHAINKATSLATLAYGMYVLGWRFYMSKKLHKQYNGRQINYRVNGSLARFLNILSFIALIAYIGMLLVFLKTSESTTNDMSSGFTLLVVQSILVVSLLISTLYKKPLNIKDFIRANLGPIFCICTGILTSLYIGDRTFPMFLGLSVILIYSLCVKQIKQIYIIFLGVIAFAFFSLIGQTRKTDNSLRSGGLESFVEGAEEVRSEGNLVMYFFDFIPAAECLYLCYEWPAQNNKWYIPGRFLVYAVSPIPYLPTLLSEVFFERPPSQLSSAYEVTNNYNSQISSIKGGLGTHVVGDIYISVGLIGVILTFFLFGYFMSYVETTCQGNIYSLMIYISMTSYAIYLARDTLYGNYRLLVIQCVLIWLISSLFGKKVQKYC